MSTTPDYRALLETAISEARQGLAEGGIPIGAALYHQDGRLLGCGNSDRCRGWRFSNGGGLQGIEEAAVAVHILSR